MADDELDEVVDEFITESHENLDQLDQGLVELKQNPDKDMIARIFRTIHTIKGTSGFLGFNTLESVTHVGESLLSKLRDGELPVTTEITSGPVRDGGCRARDPRERPGDADRGHGHLPELVNHLGRLNRGEPVGDVAPGARRGAPHPVAVAPVEAAPVVEAPAPAVVAAPVVEAPAPRRGRDTGTRRGRAPGPRRRGRRQSPRSALRRAARRPPPGLRPLRRTPRRPRVGPRAGGAPPPGRAAHPRGQDHSRAAPPRPRGSRPRAAPTTSASCSSSSRR